MSLNRLFDIIENARETANWKLAFGEPQEVEGRTLIPVAKVTHGYGLGFRAGESPDAEDEVAPSDEGDSLGGGGSMSSRPVGAFVVTPDGVSFEPALDQGVLVLARLGVVALLILQFTKTLRAIFGRD
jgi:uncharacterized spore protein YtfJ